MDCAGEIAGGLLADTVAQLLSPEMDLEHAYTSLAGKRVLLRADLNVPTDPASKAVTDKNRVTAVLPTVQALQAAGAKVGAHGCLAVRWACAYSVFMLSYVPAPYL
jgi:uncharacterized protein (DUF362 family)